MIRPVLRALSLERDRWKNAALSQKRAKVVTAKNHKLWLEFPNVSRRGLRTWRMEETHILTNKPPP
jgi:hypothetical protein